MGIRCWLCWYSYLGDFLLFVINDFEFIWVIEVSELIMVICCGVGSCRKEYYEGEEVNLIWFGKREICGGGKYLILIVY